MRAAQDFEDELREKRSEIKDITKWIRGALPGGQQVVSEQLSIFFLAMLAPPAGVLCTSDNRLHMEITVTKLAFALASYHADRAKYPITLGELKPQYIADISPDVFNNAELHYMALDGGYLLYSVGPNGQDDGGRGRDDAQPGEDVDDIVIRINAAETK